MPTSSYLHIINTVEHRTYYIVHYSPIISLNISKISSTFGLLK